jgi:hypothetical protein
MFSIKTYLLHGAVLVAANPILESKQELEGRAVNCNAVNAALSVLKVLGPPATTFCSSYLKIPATITTTSTAAASTVYAIIPNIVLIHALTHFSLGS